MNLLYIVFLLCEISYAFASEKDGINSIKLRISLEPVKDPMTSSPKGQCFREAVQSGNMSTAKNVFHGGNDKLKDYCGKHLARLRSPRLVKLINTSEKGVRAWMLKLLLVHADQPLADEIFGKLNFSNAFWRDVASSADLACMPQKYGDLLGKITDRGEQEEAVKNGVHALFQNNETKCFDPLLPALKNGTFLNAHLESVAIRKAFVTASTYPDDRTLIAKRFFNHPAISTEDYSIALYNSYKWGDQAKELFYWLLARADRQDLVAVKDYHAFSGFQFKFRNAVNQALRVVDSKVSPRRNAFIKDALESYIPMVLLGVVHGYTS